MVTGNPWSLLVTAFVVVTNMATLQANIKANKEKYGDEYVQYASKVPAVVPGLWPAISKSEANAGSQKKAG